MNYQNLAYASILALDMFRHCVQDNNNGFNDPDKNNSNAGEGLDCTHHRMVDIGDRVLDAAPAHNDNLSNALWYASCGPLQ
jgi:signal transduction histidine kinase